MLNTEDPANRRVVDFFASHEQRDEPLDEPAYYPTLERLTTHPDRAEAVLAGASPAQRWSGGSVTDLSEDLGDDWLWGRWGSEAEPGWVAAAYRAFDRA